MSVKPVVVHLENYPAHTMHGAGAIRRAIYPDLTGSRNLFIGLAEFGPGTAPHVFHRHGSELVGESGYRRRLTYAPQFEEFYFVLEGSGEMQWRFDDGNIHIEPVKAGDSVYFPPGVTEHRIFNTGLATMRVLYGGTPPALVETID
jgi:oxalate decarboxylase/phosphoglucose isomerase-like protein (cupin superfamily)